MKFLWNFFPGRNEVRGQLDEENVLMMMGHVGKLQWAAGVKS